jgi:hypothetical protein
MGLPFKTKKKASVIRDAILNVLDSHNGGIEGYLKRLMLKDPVEFNKLVAKVMPTKIANEDGEEFKIATINRVITGVKESD